MPPEPTFAVAVSILDTRRSCQSRRAPIRLIAARPAEETGASRQDRSSLKSSRLENRATRRKRRRSGERWTCACPTNQSQPFRKNRARPPPQLSPLNVRASILQLPDGCHWRLSRSSVAAHPVPDRPGKLSRSTRASFALASPGWAGEFEGRGFGAPLKARDRLASRWIPDARRSIGREKVSGGATRPFSHQ